jgi:hypothetical protein
MFDIASTEEDLKLGYKHGFKSVIEYRKSLGQTPISPATQVNQMNKETSSMLVNSFHILLIISPLTKYLCLFSSNSATTIVNQAVFNKHCVIQLGSTCPVIV